MPGYRFIANWTRNELLKRYPGISKADTVRRDRVKTMAMLPSDPRLHNEYVDLMPPVGIQVYQRYQEVLASCNAMDFGDLIMNTLLLLRRNDKVKAVLQNRYRYIMVDESISTGISPTGVPLEGKYLN